MAREPNAVRATIRQPSTGPPARPFVAPSTCPAVQLPRCARTRAAPRSAGVPQGSRRGKRRGALPQPCGPQGCAGTAGVKNPCCLPTSPLPTKSLGVIHPCGPCGPPATALECGFEPQGCTPAAPLRHPCAPLQMSANVPVLLPTGSIWPPAWGAVGPLSRRGAPLRDPCGCDRPPEHRHMQPYGCRCAILGGGR